MSDPAVEHASGWRDGLMGIAGGTAIAAFQLFYASTSESFVRPGMWARVLLLALGAGVALAAWHRWLKDRPARKRGSVIIPLVIPTVVAISLFVVTALLISHQRSKPVPMNLASQLAGRSEVQMPDGDPLLDLASGLMDWRVESNLDFDVQFKFYEGASGSDDYLSAMTVMAYRSSPQSGALADNYDDRITRRLLGAATNIDAGESLSGVSGHFRCGQDQQGDDGMVVCAFAHGVSAAIVTVPTTERNPRALAKRVMLELLRV